VFVEKSDEIERDDRELRGFSGSFETEGHNAINWIQKLEFTDRVPHSTPVRI
jgi:hypothetical protein